MVFKRRRLGPRPRIVALGLLLTTLLYGCNRVTSSDLNLRLAHGLDTQHPVHIAMEHLAQEVDHLSNGSLTVSLYPSEQLGSERELVELLQIGSVAMTKISAAVLENFEPTFSVLTLPYLFKSREHQFAVLDGVAGNELLHNLASSHLKGLGFYDAGSRSFYTCKTAVKDPSDLAGLKIRTQESASAINMVKALGASPTPISWGELYTALAQGIVDGAENNPPSFYSSRHYEVCPHYTLDEHTTVPDVLIMSKAVWQRLDPPQREQLERAVRSSVDLERTLWQEATQDALQKLEAEGVEIIRPSKAPFRKRTESLRTAAASNPKLQKILQRILEHEI